MQFGFKLEPEEFKTLEQIALINSKYLEGLITKSEFESRLRDQYMKGYNSPLIFFAILIK